MTKRTKAVEAEPVEPSSTYDVTVVCGMPYDPDTFPDSIHEANKQAVLTQAINVGFRPTGDVEFVSAEGNPASDESTLLHYSVPVDGRPQAVEAPVDEGQDETVVEDDDATDEVE